MFSIKLIVDLTYDNAHVDILFVSLDFNTIKHSDNP
jgi:hypothetical protein